MAQLLTPSPCFLPFAFAGGYHRRNEFTKTSEANKGGFMETKFNEVEDSAALEELLARSHERPVLLFKHSNTCPISARAYRQMQGVKSPVSIVVVQESREVSREVEARTGVQHETPQALVLRDGRAVWSASHFEITADAVEQALRNAEG
jgi:bacillithiol system protein YtxJ